MYSIRQPVTRRSDRKTLRMAIIMFVETEGESQRYDGFTLDVSAYGARVQAGIPLMPGQVVEFVASEGTDPVRGRVVWVGNPASEVAGQAGIEFLDPFNVPA